MFQQYFITGNQVTFVFRYKLDTPGDFEGDGYYWIDIPSIWTPTEASAEGVGRAHYINWTGTTGELANRAMGMNGPILIREDGGKLRLFANFPLNQRGVPHENSNIYRGKIGGEYMPAVFCRGMVNSGPGDMFMGSATWEI